MIVFLFFFFLHGRRTGWLRVGLAATIPMVVSMNYGSKWDGTELFLGRTMGTKHNFDFYCTNIAGCNYGIAIPCLCVELRPHGLESRRPLSRSSASMSFHRPTS